MFVGRPYYLDGLYGALAAAGALGLQRRRETRHQVDAEAPGKRARFLGWVAWPGYAASTALAGSLLAFSPALVAPDVPEAVVQDTAAAYRALGPDQQRRTAVFGQSYIYVAYLDAYGDRYGLPAVYSGNRSYSYFTPPPADTDAVLLLGSDPQGLRPLFTDVRRVGDAGLWLATGRTAPWLQIWPRLRTLTVG